MALSALLFSSAILPYLLRWKVDFDGAKHDFKWTALLGAWIHRRSLGNIVTNTLALVLKYSLWGFFGALLLSFLYFRLFLPKRESRNGTAVPNGNYGNLRPLVIPSRTSHARLFPKKHTFSYSYLLVGIPIGWRGSLGSLLSADLDSIEKDGLRPRKGWFGVEAADYLHRGCDGHGLSGKLRTYLRTQVPRDSGRSQGMAKLKRRMRTLAIIRLSISSQLLVF